MSKLTEIKYLSQNKKGFSVDDIKASALSANTPRILFKI
jgi:hypothetical protein